MTVWVPYEDLGEPHLCRGFVTGTKWCDCQRTYPSRFYDDPDEPEVGSTCCNCTPGGGERLRALVAEAAEEEKT